MSNLTEAQFKAIVDEVASHSYRVVRAVAKVTDPGYSVVLDVKTNSGKYVWTGGFHYDPETQHVTYREHHPHSNQVRAFAQEVIERIDAQT